MEDTVNIFSLSSQTDMLELIWKTFEEGEGDEELIQSAIEKGKEYNKTFNALSGLQEGDKGFEQIWETKYHTIKSYSDKWQGL